MKISIGENFYVIYGIIALIARSTADARPDGWSQPAGTTADGWSQPTGTTADGWSQPAGTTGSSTASARPIDATGTTSCWGDDGTAPSGGPTTGRESLMMGSHYYYGEIYDIVYGGTISILSMYPPPPPNNVCRQEK